jgi:hypothetical protein
MAETLRELKVGERVLISLQGRMIISRLTAITPAGNFKVKWGVSEKMFDQNGRERGGDKWHHAYIDAFDAPSSLLAWSAYKDKVSHDDMAHRLHAYQFDKESNQTLQKLLDLLRDANTPVEGTKDSPQDFVEKP